MNLAPITDQTVAGEVRAWMGRRNRSARSIALELGWTETYLGRRLNGVIPFRVPELSALAELLEVPASVFLEPPQLAGGLRRAPILGPMARRCLVSFGTGHQCDEPRGHEGPHVCWCGVPSSAELCRSGLELAA